MVLRRSFYPGRQRTTKGNLSKQLSPNLRPSERRFLWPQSSWTVVAHSCMPTARCHIPTGARCQGIGLEKYEKRCDVYLGEGIRSTIGCQVHGSFLTITK